MERVTDEERARIRRRNAEYKRKYRIIHPYYEVKEKLKPEYIEREKLRTKRRYEYKKIMQHLPHFLTV